MVKKIDSDALGDINVALGLSGAGSPVTELTDGIVDQSLSVNEIIRRGRTIAGNDGIFTGILQNVHGAANTLTTAVDPFEIGTGVIAPYPDPIPRQFDLWLLSATVRRVSGGATMTASLNFQYASAQQGWGVNDSGVAVVESPPVALAYWDTLVSTDTTIGLTRNSGPLARIGIRLPRGTNGSLEFTSVASAAATIQCQVVLGLFPTSLGQDGLV